MNKLEKLGFQKNKIKKDRTLCKKKLIERCR